MTFLNLRGSRSKSWAVPSTRYHVPIHLNQSRSFRSSFSRVLESINQGTRQRKMPSPSLAKRGGSVFRNVKREVKAEQLDEYGNKVEVCTHKRTHTHSHNSFTLLPATQWIRLLTLSTSHLHVSTPKLCGGLLAHVSRCQRRFRTSSLRVAQLVHLHLSHTHTQELVRLCHPCDSLNLRRCAPLRTMSPH
jgi:hypothetical protein